ncbi:MAG: DUF4954 family protein [Paludibacter sp.]|nr:DUF4954 family protein [Paludibacter sp.]
MRQLTQKEIATLVVYGCSAENWENIEVNESFSPAFVSNVHFSGKISLGKFDKTFELNCGIAKHSGIYNCHLHNVRVENDVYINGINNFIANYIIDNDVFIENCDAIYVEGISTFGNGARLAVVNENGGRTLKIFETLSAPLAYLLTFYRNRTKFIEATEKLISDFAGKKSSDKGKIGKNTKIINCGQIVNVNIGQNVYIQSVIKLKEGTVSENCFVGENVQASDFIFCNSAQVGGGVILERCFVGEATQINKGFSAVDSAFFANCQMFNGEAQSVFAAPFSVSHHKSTLLIAGYFAFTNAGSASNQSNHLYKLGAVHQGVIERGSKLGSNSYIVFPAHIGAFSTILGAHKSHPDISNFPFSYLVENQNESYLVPAAALKSIGTLRDAQKWQKRDMRKSENKLDLINFELFSPYTIGKILKAIDILNIIINENQNIEIIDFQNIKIKKTAAVKALEIYYYAIYLFLEKNISKINEVLNPKMDNWIDLAGLIAPENEIEELVAKIEDNEYSLEQIQNQFVTIHNNFQKYCLEWSAGLAEKLLNKKISNFTKKDIENLQEKSSNCRKNFYKNLLKDMEKEFSPQAKISYFSGDFENVRGTFANNDFAKELSKNI